MHTHPFDTDVVIHRLYSDPVADIEAVHLWMFDLDDDSHISDLILSPEELIRSAQMKNDVPRRRFERRCMLLRYVLGNLLGIAPGDVRFATGQSGKPKIENEEGHSAHFNISHSANVLLIGVSRENEIGVDVEIVQPDIDVMEVAEHYLSPNDFYILRRLPAREQARFFYRKWTAREAAVKAYGNSIGMLQNDDDFDYRIGRNNNVFPLQFEVGGVEVVGAVVVAMPIDTYTHDADSW